MAEQVLIMALSKMKSGICTAGFTTDPHPTTHLRWVRPVRPFDTLLPEDMCHSGGCLARCFDVLNVELRRPRPEPPHVEDRVADFVSRPPRLLRRLEGEPRAEFLAGHLDRAPEEVLVHTTRSLCLVHPERVWATFTQDVYSGRYEARLGFRLGEGVGHPRAESKRGVPATDVRWRALGRAWLDGNGEALHLDQEALLARLGAQDLYLTVGLSRAFHGEFWPLVVGVHAVPDFAVEADIDNL